MVSAWLLLGVAGLFETAWIICMKYSEGLSKLVPSVLTVTFLVASMFLLSQAVKELPLGTAYAVWTGIGAVGAVIMGIVLFDEPGEALRIFFIVLIVLGIVGLQLTSGSTA